MKTVALTKKRETFPRQNLVVDGEVWEDSWGSDSGLAGLWGSSLSKVANVTIRQLSEHFKWVTLDLPNIKGSEDGWAFSRLTIRLDRIDDQGQAPVESEVQYNFEFWSNPYTISDFAESIEAALEEHSEFPFKFWTRYPDSIVEGFGVQGSARLHDTINDVLLLERHLLSFRELLENKLAGVARNALSLLFSFPAPVKSACEQYLLYFGQFLSDLGIPAETELVDRAARVLFSVTPTDASHALSQIRDALETYLRLPFLSEFAVVANQFDDPAVAQLRANVLHLQSQIVLAKSVLQLKDATIQAKDTEIELLKGKIDLRTFFERTRNRQEETSSEPLIKGVVSVKKYELKFLEFDFPAILRKLKRIF